MRIAESELFCFWSDWHFVDRLDFFLFAFFFPDAFMQTVYFYSG